MLNHRPSSSARTRHAWLTWNNIGYYEQRFSHLKLQACITWFFFFLKDQCCIGRLPVHIGQGQHKWDAGKFSALTHMVTQCQRRECHWPHSEINRINGTYNVHLSLTSACPRLISYQILNELIHQLLIFGDLFWWVILFGCITSTGYAMILSLSLLLDPIKQRTGPSIQ